MINIQQINAKTMTDTRDSILQSAISSDNSRLENLNTIADWMIDNVPWVGEATNEKLNFIFNSPFLVVTRPSQQLKVLLDMKRIVLVKQIHLHFLQRTLMSQLQVIKQHMILLIELPLSMVMNLKYLIFLYANHTNRNMAMFLRM